MKYIIPILIFAASALQAQQININEQTTKVNNRNVFRPKNTNIVLSDNRVNNRVNNQINNRITNTSASNSQSNAVASPNVNVDASSISSNPSVIVTTDYVAWKRYQADRKNFARTKKGSEISPLDPRAAVASSPTPTPVNAKARYDAFLAERGINPRTIGHATLIDDKRMYVPSADQQYAQRNNVVAQTLTNAR